MPANPDDEAEKPQTYALQWIEHWNGLPLSSQGAKQNSFLLTSSDDFVHLWELEPRYAESESLRFREVLSLRFTDFSGQGYGVSVCQVTDSGLGLESPSNQLDGRSETSSVQNLTRKAFGGERNPNDMIFVFDAQYNAANGLLGVALSDGSLRLMNGRGVCLSIMQLPGCQSHLTSFCWDATGTRLATCVATGHVILWSVEVQVGHGALITRCSAVLEGGEHLLLLSSSRFRVTGSTNFLFAP